MLTHMLSDNRLLVGLGDRKYYTDTAIRDAEDLTRDVHFPVVPPTEAITDSKLNLNVEQMSAALSLVSSC